MGNKNRDRPKPAPAVPEVPWYAKLTLTEDGEASLYVSDWHGFAVAAVTRGADAASACKIADQLMHEMLVRKQVLEQGPPLSVEEVEAAMGDPENDDESSAAAG